MSSIRPVRALTATVVLAVALTGCAAGLHDETSSERSTPYVATANLGALKIRNVFVTAANTSASPGTGTSAGTTQGTLTLVVVNDGKSADTITGLRVGDNGGVTPTDTSASGTIDPGQSLVFGTEAPSGSTAPANKLTISGLSQPLLPGTTIAVTLTFQNAGSTTVQAPVIAG